MLETNWCGTLKTNSVASDAAVRISGVAITFSGSAIEGRYLTFSWRVLIRVVSFTGSECLAGS